MGIKRYRYRAYPDGYQRVMLARTFGSCRFVYNSFLNKREELYKAGRHKQVGFNQTLQEVTTLAKKSPETIWLSQVSAVPLQQSARDAVVAYQNFFDSCSGKRKGPKMKKPSLKKKGHRQAACFTNAARFKAFMPDGSKWGKVRLPKIGELRFRNSRPLPSTPTSVTVIQEPDGKYYVSFVVEEVALPTPKTGGVSAVDLGLTDLAAITTANPNDKTVTRSKVANPRFLRSRSRKLARQQRQLSRKTKGSTNWQKNRIQVAKTHKKVANQRDFHHHQLANQLVRDYDVIALETLSLAGMGRTRLSKSIYDAGLGNLVRRITEKAENQGKQVIRIGKWEPTTQTCSICATPAGRKPLSVREWTCPHCHTHLDRDYNAAVNILVAAGLAETLNACGPDVRRALAHAVGEEAGTHRTDQTYRLAA